MPPYKRLLCWRFRKSIETFGSLALCGHLHSMDAVADFSEAGSVGGESTDDDDLDPSHSTEDEITLNMWP